MLRPLVLDILALLLPLGLGALAFWGGRLLRRVPGWLRACCVAFAVIAVAGGAASFADLLPDRFSRSISPIGGGTVLLGWAALFLLGFAWSVPNRRFSPGFLACLAALAGCLLLIEASGPLWWRFGAPELWERTPDSLGRLRQTSGLTCSPAAAAMLLHRYGIPASEGEMAYLAGTSLFGSDAPAMARALNRKAPPHGWRAHAGHSGYEECVRRGQPFIAHVWEHDLGHAVLVEQISWEGVQIVDPLDGAPRQMSRADFERVWDGTVVRVDRDGS
jgi:Peptidase C39 family